MPDWNARYTTGDAVAQPPHPLIERIAREYPPGRALDLACGLGRHALCLAERGWRVTALDASQIAIAKLREIAADRGLDIDTQIQDLEAPGFTIDPDSYDLIYDCFYLQRSLIPAIQVGVRPGGLAAFVLPISKPINPEFLVRAGEVRSWFNGWEILHDQEDEVAQLIARKSHRV